MHFRFLLFIGLFIIVWSKCGVADDNGQSTKDIYQVITANLNLKDCNVAGKPVEYASNFLAIQKTTKPTESYSISTCDGMSIDELSCNGSSNKTSLTKGQSNEFEGYRFSARTGKAKNGTPQCLLTALHRRVKPLKGSYVQYERADWATLLADYNFECTREMAQRYFEANSLQCSSYIVLTAEKITP